MLRLFTELSDPIKLTLATALAQGQKSRAEKLTHTHTQEQALRHMLALLQGSSSTFPGNIR